MTFETCSQYSLNQLENLPFAQAKECFALIKGEQMQQLFSIIIDFITSVDFLKIIFILFLVTVALAPFRYWNK